MRASYSGNTPASQADAEGSIPFARSNNNDSPGRNCSAGAIAHFIVII